MAKHKKAKGGAPQQSVNVNEFSFSKGSKGQRPMNRGLPTFKAGDVQPSIGKLLVELVIPPKPEGEDESVIITKGSAVTNDGQRVVLHGKFGGSRDQVGKAMQDEVWRILAKGSDYYIHHGTEVPFQFGPGDEVLIHVQAATTAHGLQYPDDKGEDDDRPTRFIVDMGWVMGRVARTEEHLKQVHGEDYSDG